MPREVEMSRSLAVADVYAAALFELAREQDAVDEIRAEFGELIRGGETDSARSTGNYRSASIEFHHSPSSS